MRVFDVDSAHGVHFLVMQFVDGESAGERVNRKGRLPELEAVQICLGAARGLAEAHRKGIVHRDVKPDNIMVDTDGHVRVADLGLAKAVSSGGEGERSMLTATHAAMGTPHFMSPEQFTSARDVGPAADVWSLGVTLYQLLANDLPWAGDTIFHLIAAIQSSPPRDIRALRPNVSDGLVAIVRRALEKDASSRYPDCAAMADALQSHLESLAARDFACPQCGKRCRLSAETTTATLRCECGASFPAPAETTSLSLSGQTLSDPDAGRRSGQGSPPPQETFTLIAQAALDGPHSPPSPRTGTETPSTVVSVVDVLEKRMKVEKLRAAVERAITEEGPTGQGEALAAIDLDIRVAREAAADDPAGAMGRLERAARALAVLDARRHAEQSVPAQESLRESELLPTAEQAEGHLSHWQNAMPVARSAYKPSGKLPFGAVVRMMVGTVYGSIAGGLAGAILAALTLKALYWIAGFGFSSRWYGLTLMGSVAFAGIGVAWAAACGIPAVIVAARGKAGKNRSPGAAAAFGAASAFLALVGLRLILYWLGTRYGFEGGNAIIETVAGTGTAAIIAFGLLLPLGTAVGGAGAADEATSAKFCEQCEEFMAPETLQQISLEGARRLSELLKRGDVGSAAGVIQATPGPPGKGGCPALFECRKCGNGFLELRVHFEEKCKGERGASQTLSASWLAGSAKLDPQETENLRPLVMAHE
jgi:hypothetical protein